MIAHLWRWLDRAVGWVAPYAAQRAYYHARCLQLTSRRRVTTLVGGPADGYQVPREATAILTFLDITLVGPDEGGLWVARYARDPDNPARFVYQEDRS